MRARSIWSGAILWAALSGPLLARGPSTTYHVRPDGGSRAQCTGLTDAPYTGETGTLPQSCAWDHPFRAFPPGGAAVIAPGDTLIIASGDYAMGIGAPETDLCDPGSPSDCYMAPIPSGPDPDHPTRVLGAGSESGCSSRPQLWGNGGAGRVIDLAGASNVEISCLEVTDHLDCVQLHAKPSLRCESRTERSWAAVGIHAADAVNVLLRNVDVHGLAHTGIEAPGAADWTVEDVRIAGNGWRGWSAELDGDSGTDTTGRMSFRRFTVAWNGCGETWPGGNPSGCWSRSAGGDGDGFAAGPGAATWDFEEAAFVNNAGDGLRLTGLPLGSSVQIRRSLVAGNAGNQIEAGGEIRIENSIVVGSCGSFLGEPFTFSVEPCQSGGDALLLQVGSDSGAILANNTVTGEGGCLLRASCREGESSRPLVIRNNIFQGQISPVSLQQSCLASFSDCASDPFDIDYSVTAGVAGAECPGPNDLCTGSTGLVDASMDRFDARLSLDSPALDSGLAVDEMLIPPLDFAGSARPFGPGVDRGAYEMVPAALPRPERVCRSYVRRRLIDLFRLELDAIQDCIDAVNRGVSPGPCPDSRATERIVQAVARLTPDRIGRRCPLDVIASGKPLSRSCQSASTLEELTACIVTEAESAVRQMVEVEFSRPDGALPSSEQQRCQSGLAKVFRTYAVRRFGALSGCLARRDNGRLLVCPDAGTKLRLDLVAARLEPRLSLRCADEIVRQLQAEGGFGGGCADAVTLAELVRCQSGEHEAQVDLLIDVAR